MITLGIVLLVIGALVAAFVPGDVARLGYIAAVIGLVLIILGALFGVVDETGNGEELGALFLPFLKGMRS